MCGIDSQEISVCVYTHTCICIYLKGSVLFRVSLQLFLTPAQTAGLILRGKDSS